MRIAQDSALFYAAFRRMMFEPKGGLVKSEDGEEKAPIGSIEVCGKEVRNPLLQLFVILGWMIAGIVLFIPDTLLRLSGRRGFWVCGTDENGSLYFELDTSHAAYKKVK